MTVPYRLLRGHHDDPISDGGGCIQDLVSIYSGHARYQDGQWLDITDTPPCVCPVIQEYTIRVNDILPDDERQRLLPYLPRISGTRSPAHEQQRVELIAMHAIRHTLPIALRAAGRADEVRQCDRTASFKGWATEEAYGALEAADAAQLALKAADVAEAAAQLADAAEAAARAAVWAETAAVAAKTSMCVTKEVQKTLMWAAKEAHDSMFLGLDLLLSVGPSGDADEDVVALMREMAIS